MLLEIDDLNVYYGRVHAVKGLTLGVEEGEIVALVGANGAGKTTTLRTVSGLHRARSGRVTYCGRDIRRVPGCRLPGLGLSQVPERRHIFPSMTVYQNLMMGAYLRRRGPEVDEDLEFVHHLFPRLIERKDQFGGTLSGGEQQMLAIGRALMARPRMLLLDEPSMGLAPLVVKQIFEIIRQINRQGVSVLVVEQNAVQALKMCQRAYVIETGRIVHSGSGQELLNDDAVRRSYLGITAPGMGSP